MVCKLERPEPQVLFNRVKDMFSVNVLGGATVIPESNEWYVVANDYAMQEEFYAIADQMWRETNPETACCENLAKMAARNGVYPKPATFAQTYMRLSGTPGAALPSSLEFSTSIGTFVSLGIIPAALDNSGIAIVRAQAILPGSTYNSQGAIIDATLVTAAPGVNTAVDVCGGYICGGAEAENCEAFRARYLTRLAYKPRATSAWIKEQILMFPCVTRVCERTGSCCRCGPDDECGCLACSDKLEFYALFDNSFPCGIPPGNVVNEIRNLIFGEHQGYGEGLVEIGVCGNIYAPIPLPTDVIIDIVGCPTLSQKQQIEADITDLFSTICPSQVLKKKQIELIIAQVIGVQYDTNVEFDVFGAAATEVYVSDCGDLEPTCDRLPCLNSIEFIGGGGSNVDICK